MERILAVVGEDERTEHVLCEAVERAERSAAELVVMAVTPESEYYRKQRALAGIGSVAREGYTYTFEQAEAAARRRAERRARSAVGDAVPYRAVGAVGRPVEQVLAVADAHDCDEVVVAATRRLFGLLPGPDRQLARRFPGTVTPVSRPAPGQAVSPGPIAEPDAEPEPK